MGSQLSRRAALAALAGFGGGALVGCAPERAVRPRLLDPISVPPFEAPVAVTPPPPPAIDVEAVILANEHRSLVAWGTDFAGVVRTGAEAGHATPGAVFLTLDACGGPVGSGFDEALISGLRAAGIPATLFLNLRWIRANPDLAAGLAADPLFSIQNHGSAHLPLSVTGASAYGIPGTTNARSAAMEVWENHVAIEQLTGIAPRWFRPGTAHLDDVGLSIAEGLGERIAGFAINGDGGATLPAEAVAGAVSGAVGGELIIAHMNQPMSGSAAGILAGARTLRDRGIAFGVL
ncbi:polysaccharide deacetylase family protein [Leucobacter rhizosphaerae]|uniref:Polysaccharide deacetylase family protein n=1 Tax=Leucobacter rhizosphaerae TaxID=2932245 RepID=A0ABY4FYJ6_9MICO|nr:polysaccharide deacetylase family protein [Leucobacter rhizosphaerae]UOQ61362.1 polysaccharide deacetylase family protein [Leucobacter rhizosphaerae]